MPVFGHYLMFDRACAEAMEFYKEAFGGEILEMRKYGDMPPNPAFPVAEADKGLVLHARLRVGDTEIMAADGKNRRAAGENMYITMTAKDAAAVQKAWDALKEGAEVYMDLAPTFFAALHGSLRDRFGINWMFTVLVCTPRNGGRIC